MFFQKLSHVRLTPFFDHPINDFHHALSSCPPGWVVGQFEIITIIVLFLLIIIPFEIEWIRGYNEWKKDSEQSI
jgi:hypothetical protein